MTGCFKVWGYDFRVWKFRVLGCLNFLLWMDEWNEWFYSEVLEECRV